eukprot:CAMPEP_0198288210 /NCGR_PEP_ID=MMETSP1449-20131203/6798_1 /TAXON_ID=420275 /ORGANISM="Attheya septentrionalis, Strain CCMP2084" /LENGTH=582 /DNA_ID=CAMNT_0043986323 /DNA_START=238 /DNA_END=1986 /DNA_ORIENTATION=-
MGTSRRSVPVSFTGKDTIANDRWSCQSTRSLIQMSSSESNIGGEIEYVKADDGEALQALFAKQCDSNGLMTKEKLRAVPAIADLLDVGDILSEELDDIWDAAPKFPDIEADAKMDERIDVDGFVQIYRDIDDLFEQGEAAETAPAATSPSSKEGSSTGDDKEASKEVGNIEDDEDELENAFANICDSSKLVSREALREWEEIRQLLEEGMLGEDEFDEMWKGAPKSPGSPEQLDVDGFLSFNVALDELFVFDEEGEDGLEGENNIGDDDVPVVQKKEVLGMVVGDDLPPGVIFADLAGGDLMVGMKELARWKELQGMLLDGELQPTEFQSIFDGIKKAPGTTNKLDEDGFIALYEALDALFEEFDEEEELEAERKKNKQYLVSLLSAINSDEDRLPIGLETTDTENEEVVKAVVALETAPTNKIITSRGTIKAEELAGTWELLYQSSSSMVFNQGLTGVGKNLPRTKFSRLLQKLEKTKYSSDVDFIETWDVGIGEDNSFDVTVTGDWELRDSISLFTGEPSLVLKVVAERVKYGVTDQQAEYWKSLGPMLSLDMTYLDDDLRIMRGNTSKSSIFVLRRFTE